MSDNIIQLTGKDKPEQEEPQATEATEATEAQTNLDLENFTCGYVVGVDKEGKIVFEVLGEKVGLVELLGLQEYARERIKVAGQTNEGYGPAVVSQQLNQIGHMVQVLLQMATQSVKNNFTR